MDALFEQIDATTYQPSELTRGGWSDEAQHGGPPAALMAHAIGRHESPVPMMPVRFTFDLIKPVPLEQLTVATGTLRSGKRVELVGARVLHQETVVARGLALRIRTAEVDLAEPGLPTWDPPPPPDQGAHPEWKHESKTTRFHRNAVEIVSIDKTWETRGPGTGWFRLNQPVVAGTETSPAVRAAAISDLTNGVTQTLDPWRVAFINPDITLYLHRLPVGEWIGLAGRAHPHPNGVGVAEAEMFDLEGPVGRVVLAQFIAEQRPMADEDGSSYA